MRLGVCYRSLRTVIILLLLPLLLGACAQGELQPQDVEQVGTPGGDSALMMEPQTIVVGLTQAPSSLDPGDHRERESETVIRNMFDGLVTRDKRNGVHLELAEAIEWLDEQTLVVKLRRGVLFHDGTEMTADDVVFTFERIIFENGIEYPVVHTSVRKGLVAPLVSVEKGDDYTVVMGFSGPWPVALQMLVHQQIVPKRYLQEVGTEGFIAHPIGTGPFKFVSASPNFEEIILERFDDYYGGAPDLPPVGPACVERVILRAIPDNLTRVAALRGGEVDIIQGVPADLVRVLEEAADVEVRTAPGTRPAWMDMNVNQPPFDDLRVRQAMNYALDKDRIIAEVYDGRAIALAGPLSPYNGSVNQALTPYPYDPQVALSLLEEAGWADSDGDSILDSEGLPFAFTIDTLEVWDPLAEEIADQLRMIGVDVTLRLWERSVIRPHLLAGTRTAYLDGWGDSAFDPVGHFEAKWHGYVEGQPYGRGNYSGYDNARVNELIRVGEVTANPADRQRIYDEAQEIIYEEAPAVFLILVEEIGAASTRVLDWEPASDGRINLHDVCLAP